MRVAQLKSAAARGNDVWHSDPGGFDSNDLGSVSVFIQMHRMNDPRERKIKLVMKPWACIKDMKDQLQSMFNIPTSAQQLYYKGTELANARNLVQCGLYHDKVVVDLVLSANGRKNRTNLFTIHPYGNHVFPKAIMKATHLAMQGLALGLTPELAMDGTGGTYFLKDPSQRKVCCFKPQNEEPFGPCNPRGFVGPLGEAGFRKGVLSGEACEREVAAYLLDKDHFAGVPATTLAEVKHPAFKYSDGGGVVYKMGSLQEFVRHDDVASDLSPSMFTAHQVHKIVLLDMRIVNTDRNDANLLVRKRRNADGAVEHELIPIDHGYSIPDAMEASNDRRLDSSRALDRMVRLVLVQLAPTQSPHARRRPRVHFKPECRARNSKARGPRPVASGVSTVRFFLNLHVAGLLVEKGVRKRVLLHDLARIMCRDDMDIPSTLETMCADALHHVLDRPSHTPRGYVDDATDVCIFTSPCRSATNMVVDTNTMLSKIKPTALRIDTAAVEAASDVLDGLKSPLGFWASKDPFENPRPRRTSVSSATSPRSPAFSPRADAAALPSWGDLCQGFHPDAKDLFNLSVSPPPPVAATLESLPPKCEKQFLTVVGHLLDHALDQILLEYEAKQNRS
ncbi:Aste57867_17378 [Aphanomyces stellatus]|uniref:Aste57867_17378 protein n=1 Tax=Aphanomyces stellatus TaxID=120398 RepID=A0A485L7W3_9STRA|nr:hypothetical protein As57867_017318 [Aphanomyces stellatus]VFT94134.1 Aste57867_17378 [Aphanomyces stellatus]